MNYRPDLICRMHTLISNLSITNPEHTDTIRILKLEAESIMRQIAAHARTDEKAK